MSETTINVQAVKDYLLSLQDDICSQLAEEDGSGLRLLSCRPRNAGTTPAH